MEKKMMLWNEKAPDTDVCGDQAQPSLTAFEVPGARGAMVVCPGGAYAMKAGHEGAPIARMLASAGISAYVLDYRCAPCRPDTPLHDAQRAIRVVRSLGYEKVGIIGFSAGGNLCCCAATMYDRGNPDAVDPIERYSCRPDVFVPCYAVVSFNCYLQPDTVQNLLGAQRNDPALLNRYSAEKNVTPDTPPAFIWHTADDGCVPCQHSLLLALHLADAGVSYELHVYPHGEHGLGLAQESFDVSAWNRDCTRFLIGHGFGR